MESLFLDFVNRGISALWLIAAVVLLRAVLYKAPKKTHVIMWGIVGLRLVIPFSLESKISVIPSANTFPSEFLTSSTPKIESGIPIINTTVNPIIQDSLATSIENSVNPAQVLTAIASYIWLIGIAVLICYTVISGAVLYRKVRFSLPLENNVRLCDEINAPFLLGIIRPRIYIPTSLEKEYIPYVVAHENVHIQHKDNVLKPIAFLIACVYWFVPWVWIAFILFCRDLEASCDEAAVNEMDADQRKIYANALVECSSAHGVGFIPLAFGEKNVKKRICSVLSFRKHKKVWIVIGVLVCIALCLFFLTNPGSDNTNPDNTPTVPEGPGTNPGDTENIPAAKATVVVKIDGVVVEPYSGFYYACEGGVSADGALMFVPPPNDEIPEFILTNGMEITINGNKEETVKSVKDMSIQTTEYSFDVDDIPTLKEGKYLINFIATGVGTGKYANDRLAYSYYFYIVVEK